MSYWEGFGSAISIIILGLTGYIIFMRLFAYWGRMSPAKEETVRRDTMGVFAELASKSYGEVEINSVFEVSAWRFRLLSLRHANRIWFWEVTHAGNADPIFSPVQLVIVIRGTHTVQDWVNRNFKLIAGVLGQHSDYENMIVKEYMSEIASFVGATRSLHNKKVAFCGHSLGASVAEAIHGKLLYNKQSLPGNLKSLGSITFDSPGQPESYRLDVQNGMTEPLQSSFVVNARPNIVNMLNRPIAATLYACGGGSEINMTDISFSVPSNLLKLVAWRKSVVEAGQVQTIDLRVILHCVHLIAVLLLPPQVVYSFLVHQDRSHSMDDIKRHIRENNIHAERPADWPVYSLWVLKGIFRILDSFTSRQQQQQTAEAEVALNVVEDVQKEREGVYEEQQGAPVSPADEQPEAPDALDALEANVCYKISTDQKTTALFKKANTEKHLVIPFFGLTNQGKTTSLAKLFCPEYRANDKRNPFFGLVKNGVNNSPLPLIMLWKEVNGVRVYILDMPGLGAGYGVRSTFWRGTVSGDYHTLMASFHHLVSQSVLIQRGTMTDAYQGLLRSLKKLVEKDIRVIVAYNVDRQVTRRSTDLQQRRDHYVTELTKLHVAHDIVPYCACVTRSDNVYYAGSPEASSTNADDFFTIDDLRERLDLIVRTHHLKILRDQHKRNNWYKAPPRDMGSFQNRMLLASLVPVLGPSIALYQSCQQGRYVDATMEAACLGVDIFTMGSVSGYRNGFKIARLMGPSVVAKVAAQFVTPPQYAELTVNEPASPDAPAAAVDNGTPQRATAGSNSPAPANAQAVPPQSPTGPPLAAVGPAMVGEDGIGSPSSLPQALAVNA